MFHRNKGRSIVAFAIVSVLSGCAVGQPKAPPPDAYDLGPSASRAAPAGSIPGTLMVADVASPPWLDTNAMYYRLAYADGAKVQAYAHSRWVASAPDMISARLRARLAEVMSHGVVAPSDGARGDTQLKVELDEFDHVFDSPAASRAVIRARATLIKRIDRGVIAQRAFLVDVPAATSAPGAVKAFSAAVDQLDAQIVDWVTASLTSRNAALTGAPPKMR